MKDYLKEQMRFVVKTELFIGNESARDLPTKLKDKQWNKIGLVVDQGLYKNNSYTKEIIELLQSSLEQVVLLINQLPEPTYGYLDEVKIKFKEYDLDCFIGIGGGSTLDLAKGLATLQTNSGKAINYRGFPKLINIPLPVVALPSTAGTGSEVTPYAVFIDTKANWKFGINSEYNYPDLAFHDSRFLDSCPAKIFASAGMDALSHALESFVAKNATFVSRLFSQRAFKLLFENLKGIAKGDRSTETKLNLLVGSGCAGVALMNSGLGPAGALSYPLGVYFDVPHGLACSVFVPGVIKYNVENGYDEYSQLYDLVFEKDSFSVSETIKSISGEPITNTESADSPICINRR